MRKESMSEIITRWETVASSNKWCIIATLADFIRCIISDKGTSTVSRWYALLARKQGLEDIMNERIEWIQHKGKRILYIDASNIQDENEFLQLFIDAEAVIIAQPKGHAIRTLFYSPNSTVTKAISDRAKQVFANAKENGIPTGPTVWVGSSGFQRAVVTAMQFFIKEIHIANSIEEGKEWLAAQEIV
jgi:hypothetical protein